MIGILLGNHGRLLECWSCLWVNVLVRSDHLLMIWRVLRQTPFGLSLLGLKEMLCGEVMFDMLSVLVYLSILVEYGAL